MYSTSQLSTCVHPKKLFSLNKLDFLNGFKIILFYLSSYFLALYAYYLFINPIYAYMGFEWNPNISKIIEGSILTFFLAILLPKTFTKPSEFLLNLQFCFPILPMLVLYGATNAPRTFLYCTVIAFIVLITIAYNAKIKRLKLIKISYQLLEKTLLTISFLFISSIIFMGGYKYINFDIFQVYENRSAAAENLPAVYGYLSPLVSKVLLPFSLLLAIVNRNYLFAILAVIGSILMFGLTSHKGPLFYPLALIILHFIINRKNPILILIYGYFFIISLSSFSFNLNAEQGLIGNLMLRRSYFVPAHLNFVYYDFFSTNPFTLWSQSKISLGIIDYPYSIDISHLIGLNYYNNEETGANTGWIGSGYANAGFVGMLIYALIIGLTFSLLDTYAKLIGKALVTTISFAPIFTMMVSSDLPTAFLNHGVILVLILFSIFPANSMPTPNYYKNA